MSRWDEPMGKVETDMTPHELAAMQALKRIDQDYAAGKITEEDMVEIFTHNWVDYGNDE